MNEVGLMDFSTRMYSSQFGRFGGYDCAEGGESEEF